MLDIPFSLIWEKIYSWNCNSGYKKPIPIYFWSWFEKTFLSLKFSWVFLLFCFSGSIQLAISAPIYPTRKDECFMAEFDNRIWTIFLTQWLFFIYNNCMGSIKVKILKNLKQQLFLREVFSKPLTFLYKFANRERLT
jgi:hypothetical protein